MINYASYGTTIAAEAVAAAVETPWDTLAEQALFDRNPDAQALENHTEIYQNPYFGNALVLHESGQLILALGPNQTCYPLPAHALE